MGRIKSSKTTRLSTSAESTSETLPALATGHLLLRQSLPDFRIWDDILCHFYQSTKTSAGTSQRERLKHSLTILETLQSWEKPCNPCLQKLAGQLCISGQARFG